MGATNSKEATTEATEATQVTQASAAASQIAEIRPRHGEQRGARQVKGGSSNDNDDDDEEDEEDDWDKRIFSTGCADEQTKMNDCYYDKRDWRACSQEMLAFKECWKRNGNDVRTSMKDA